MPFKDPEARKAYHKAYNQRLTEEQVTRKRETDAAWWDTPRGKYASHRNRAKRSDVPFEISFEDWLQIWKESGHFEERAATGYVMCRKGDEGPYSKENVYIAHSSINKQDAWFNNKICLPNTKQFYKDLN